MKFNLSIFKSYDIRGVYPSELNREAAYRIGQVFAEYTRAKKIVVGRDMRISSPALFVAITKGINDKGIAVCDIGQVPTECIYFAVGYYGYDAGIMVTASHNPKEYNGFKMIKKGINGIEFVRGKDLIGKFKEFSLVRVENKGQIEKKDIWQDYINHIFSFINLEKIKPFKIVVDTGNGMAGKVIPKLVSKLPVNIIPLNFNLDGNFPVHSPNPLVEGAVDQVVRKIRESKANFGFIFDGDADRIFLIDEKGNFIKSDITLLVLAKYLLEEYPGKGIAYNLICSKAVPDFVRKWKGKPIRTAVGFVNVINGIRKNDGVMGGEISGHFCFKDNFYCDSGFITFLILLQAISESDRKVSEITEKLSIYAKEAEINFAVKDKEAMLDKVKEIYADGKQDHLDGVTVDYNNWWFNLRPSQTEPLLRLTIEADSKELLEEKKKELVALIQKEN